MKKFLLILLVTMLACTGLLLVACNGDKGTDDKTETTTTTGDNGTPEKPDDKVEDPGVQPNSVTVNKVRVQLLNNNLVRLEVKGPKGFEDRASYNVVKRTNWDDVKFTTETADGFTVVTTEAYKVYVPENAKNLANSYITDLEGNVLWHYESDTNSNVYLPSPSDELDSWYFTDAPRVIPSKYGYSVVEDYSKNNGWDLSNDATDTFVFLPDGDYENFTSNFVKLTGQSELVTMKMLGYWDSRWYAYNSETALKQIQDYLDRGYSIDVLVIDTDWRKTSDSGIGYDINTALFPNMKKFLEKAHAMGVDIMFNDHPEPVQGTNNLLDKKEIEYRSNNLKLILSLGLDYWWYDRNWHTALKPIDNDISIYASGMYAFQFVTEEYYESITDVDEYARRALIMANVDGILNGILEYAPELSAHRYSIQWTGDIDTGAKDLEYEIFNAIYGGTEMGIPYMSADLGGHRSEVSDDMYVRWIQFGAFSPIMRVHCTRPFSRMPWLYGKTAEAVTHQYTDMRYRLLPLYYALSHENYTTGLPLLRRLDIAYPQYSEADANDQYLLGDSILIAPIADSYATADDTKFTTSDGKNGLFAEYYSNKSLSGTPTFTKIDEKVYFDWGQNSPDGLTVKDNFSIRWTGNIEIGKHDTLLRFYADDGIKVWIDDQLAVNGWTVYDQYLTTKILEAGTTHTIKIEYFDSGSNAHIYMDMLSTEGVEREVFIPDGEWMDVWTGETFVGPTTITVSHQLETSPIFVRMGTVLALADNMKNTDEKNWSHLTLDIYPSINFDSSFTLYEDDRETVAYKDGKFRETEITMTGEGNSVTVTIPAAKGTFSGAHAFADRNWTVRMHGRDGWGALTSVTLNGKAVTFKTVAADITADPFSIIGAARTNVTYEFSFDSKVDAESVLVFTFASTTEDKVNKDYDSSEAKFDVSVETLKKASTKVNLTDIGNKDWALFGAVQSTTVYRKNVANHLIGNIETVGGGLFSFNDNYSISWKDGDVRASGSTTNGPVSHHEINITLKATTDTTHYELYLGGYKGIAKLTVRDRAGNVETLTFGDISTNFYRKVIIECSAETDTEIYVTYALLSGDNITFSAVAASDGKVDTPTDPDDNETPDTNEPMISLVTPYTEKFDLTANGTVDWEYYGRVADENDRIQRKAGATDIIVTEFTSAQGHDDNKAEVTWSDGASITSTTTRHGLNGPKQTVTVETANAKTIMLLAGAWNAKNSMTIYDENGNAVETQIIIQAGGDAVMALVSIDLSNYEGERITIELVAAETSGGNVSLTAVTVK